MSKLLITSDLHFTSKPLDSYRFGLVDWLCTTGFAESIDALFILGDLTDSKDRHSSALVNRIVHGINFLAQRFPVVILRGNHDYIEGSEPYFGFLEAFDNVYYVKDQRTFRFGNTNCKFIPHQFTPYNWPHVMEDCETEKVEYLFLHHTFKGSITSSGYEMDGDSTRALRHPSINIYSGDIHVPQKVGPVTYVGAPYSIRYNDEFQPRVLLLDGQRGKDLSFPCLRRRTFYPNAPADLCRYDLHHGDQIKVRMSVGRDQFRDIPTIRKEVQVVAEKLGVSLAGVEFEVEKRDEVIQDQVISQVEHDPKIIVEEFGKQEKLGESVIERGKSLCT
jgi:3',5'-cyclic AMP phosphodiesterase CpdA